MAWILSTEAHTTFCRESICLNGNRQSWELLRPAVFLVGLALGSNAFPYFLLHLLGKYLCTQ
jgi:hypothetical protein